MLTLIGRRLLNSIGILLVSTFVVYVLVAMAGDPLAEMRERQPPIAENVIQAEANRLGLDQPVVLRYVT